MISSRFVTCINQNPESVIMILIQCLYSLDGKSLKLMSLFIRFPLFYFLLSVFMQGAEGFLIRANPLKRKIYADGEEITSQQVISFPFSFPSTRMHANSMFEYIYILWCASRSKLMRSSFLLWMRKVSKEVVIETRAVEVENGTVESRIIFHLPMKRWLMFIQTTLWKYAIS